MNVSDEAPAVGLRVQGCRVLGFMVYGLGLMVYGLGYLVQGLGLRVNGLGFRVFRSGFRVQGLKVGYAPDEH